ncbi:MAG: hypothetical protein ACXVA9_08140 [Bdellovibrionales bacterium]
MNTIWGMRSRKLSKSSYCSDGGMIGCDLDSPMPRTMGALDGELIPAEQNETSSPVVTAFVFLLTFASAFGVVAKWQAFTPALLGFLCRRSLISSGKKKPERRTQNIPVQNNRRAS